MDSRRILELLQSVKSGAVDINLALKSLKDLPYEDIGTAKIDHHRLLRQGVPEVVFTQGKTPEQAVAIARKLYEKSGRLLMTRATKEIFELLNIKDAVFHPASGIVMAGGQKRKKGNVLVISAGTSDIPIAEEAMLTASFLGSKTTALYDVGVAGIHRLLDKRELFDKARVVIVVAGMEGALPSVVGGLTDKPVVAVPTSVGYGTSLGGLTALFAMLNSCVPGIGVMNIDNGFGAGCLAHKINTL